jgi:hypothetical protein
MKKIRFALFAIIVLLCCNERVAAQSNGVLREVWFNITGSTVADLTNDAAFPTRPSMDGVITNGFEAPTDIGDNYGQRLRALLIPPTNGNYYFLIASDDASQLYISTNATPAGKRLIAHVDGWTSPRSYHSESGQKSAAIPLIAGQSYYLEALMKEGGGEDNLCVTWQKPGEGDPADGSAPIPNVNLVPYGVGPPTFIVQPKNITVIEAGSATFSAQLGRALGASLQWLGNGTNIPGATSATFTLATARLADSGSTFLCRATNIYGTNDSTTAILTVIPDTTRPTLTLAQSFGDNTLLTVGFSEPVDPFTATAPGNYFINNGIGIFGATLLDGGTSVVLRTAPMAMGTTYLLTVNNVQDRAQIPNIILPDSQRSFSLTYSPLDSSFITGTNEPAGPSSRRTPLAITEIMYHPLPRADGKNLEFIELYNSNPWPEDLSGYRLSGDIGYTFPNGIAIGAQSYRVIAARPADVQAVHGLSGVLGPFTNSTPGNATNVLNNGGGTIRLRDELGAVLLEITYSDQPHWPAEADGAGHSLVLARPSYGEGDVRAWAKSDQINGSPGAYDASTSNRWRTVLINEILAHTDPPLEDFVELFNYSASPVTVGDCILTDDPSTNRFRIPTGTIIPQRGFLAFTPTQLGFALNASGETIYLLSSDGLRVIDALRFGAQENGVSFGRFPDGAPRFRRLASVTQGAANSPPRASDVVINEIMYRPANGDDAAEFVELYNLGTNLAGISQWRLHGGISYTFPLGTAIPAGGYLVVANNLTNLLATHTGLSPSMVLENYGAKLGNGGDQVTLDMPDELVSTNQAGLPVTNGIHIVVDQVSYRTAGRWGRWSDGGGSSLERVDVHSDGTLAPNWDDSDETAKSDWKTVEFTGLLDNGAMASADDLQIFLLGAGECLLDNVEVIPQGGTNVVTNSTFDIGADAWFFQGTHDGSYWQPAGGYSGGCLHVVASDRGDTSANRIRTALTQTLAEGTRATLRAKVRWLKGDGEILLRLHGNWLEAVDQTLTTQNLGSPGVRNTRFRTNAGPAISDVRHTPILPTAGQSVMVTAQLDDPDSIANARLMYRVDPATAYTPVAMSYRGAGFYSALIPSQAPGTRVAFYIEARDANSLSAMTRFPADAPARECLVGFGETTPAGSLASYRLWVSQSNVTRWTTREKQSNEPLDATFVYAGCRVCYNVGTLYSGSPYHVPSYNSPDGSPCDYEVNFAKDDALLGAGDFVLATIGNLNSDSTYQGEQTSFWMMRKVGTPYMHRRYIRLFFNGQQRSVVYEDGQQPNAEVVSEFYPGADSGNLHKVEDWFEFADNGDTMLGHVDATLQNFTTTGGAKKTARYRWNWRPRATSECGHAFTNLFRLVDAMNSVQTEPYRSWVSSLVDVEEFMRVLAVERVIGNWDSYGFGRGKNMFAYKPPSAPWGLLPWDLDFVFNTGGNPVTDPLFNGNDPVLVAFRTCPEFQRAYWRAFQAAVDGPLQATTLAAFLDPRYSALLAAGVGPDSPQSIKDYAASRRTYILSQLATVAAPFAVNSSVIISNGMGLLSGTAPISLKTVEVNGKPWTLTWTSVSNWVAAVPLQTGSNSFRVLGLDAKGAILASMSNSVAVTYTNPVPSPVGAVVINELMANPAVPATEYAELYNASSTQAFDLSGWDFHGLDYTFPNGSAIPPRGYLVLVKDRAAFNTLYGPGVVVFDQYDGNLQANGETLSLLIPGSAPGTNTIVDRVRYEAGQPWATTVPGFSLQLRDAMQDNARVANWAAGSVTALPPQSIPLLAYTNAWKYMQVSNLDGVNWTAPAFNDSAWPSGAGLLAYENNTLITPLIRTILNPPATTTNNAAAGHAYYFRTKIVVTNDLAGFTINASAYLDDGAVFYVNGAEARRVRITDGVVVTNLTFTTGQPPGGDATSPDTFTFDPALFLRGTNLLAVEVHQNQPASSDITFGLQLTANFAGSSNYVALATPGASNSVATVLPAFPSLWLNEAQAENLSGPVDNAGQHKPWVELFNAGTNAISLAGYYLSPNYTNLSAWAFPANASVPAGGFLLVWCDTQTNQTTSATLHSSFRLSPGAGQIALSRTLSNTVQLVDYLTYMNLASNWSYGDLPDGQPFYRGAMFHFSPGASNNAASPPLAVFINEWMADNTRTLADPANHDYQDWFEIYNPGDTALDLGGFYLTDDLTDKFQYMVPNNGHYVIPPGGFVLVWADNKPEQNTTNRADLHTNFALSKAGEAIGIFAADGTQIDAVSFGPQTSDVSQGRFPDGSANIVALTIPTPGATNVMPNTPPILASIPDEAIILGQTLAFTATAFDTNFPPQRLTFSLGPGAPTGAAINAISGQFSWTPECAPATNSILVVVTDDGMPSMSATQAFTVTVSLPPTIAVRRSGDQLELTWPQGTLQEADQALGPYHDVTTQSPFSVDLTEARKFYRLRF